ncbi:MAG: LssY C-terminal domain-containing protein [Acidobacteriia bacterium]|nr:LssY C-terminal domain-containing protein [Terriglobia bacterium]
MHGKRRRSVWVGLVLVLQGAADLRAATLLTARLLTPLSSYRSKPGDLVQALVNQAPCSERTNALPEGTTLSGLVRNVRKVGLGLTHETAGLRLDFYELRTPDGRTYGVETRLVGVDNARERIDRRGAIHGIRATASLSSRVGSRLAMETLEHPLLLGPALILESSLFRFPNPEIEYGRGTDLNLEVGIPEPFANPSACSESSVPAELRGLVADLPSWSYSKRQPQPMDLVNLMFAGSRRALDAAFAAAGWTGSQPNSVAAGIHVVRALAEEHEYADAPMRMLLLSGDQPDLTLQTALNTFEKRDHLRIWKQAAEWQGQPTWASAATRDLGATFSMGHPFGFTHEIQGDVDLERDKVVSDLQSTGCVDSVEYVERPRPVHTPGSESRKEIHSDSRVAVVVLNECAAPRQDFAEAGPDSRPPLAIRLFRRVSLTARNHIIRDNIFYRSGDAARLGVLAVRSSYIHRRDERRAEEEDARRASPPPAALAAATPNAE